MIKLFFKAIFLSLLLFSCTAPTSENSAIQNLSSLTLIHTDNKWHFETTEGERVSHLGDWNAVRVLVSNPAEFLFFDLQLGEAHEHPDFSFIIEDSIPIDWFNVHPLYFILEDKTGQTYLLDEMHPNNLLQVALSFDAISEHTKALCLTGLHIDTFPKMPGKVKQIEQLIIADTKLTHIDATALNAFESLQYFDFIYNKWVSLDFKPNHFKHLSHLNLYFNYFSSPEEINTNYLNLSNLQSLKHLDLSFNALQKLPTGVETLSNLTFLDLTHNHLGQLPTELKKLKTLQQLSLIGNYIPDSSIVNLQKQLPECQIEYGEF